MPVALFLGGESPGDRVPVQTVVDVRVLGNVAVIVIIDERVAVDRVVERQCGDDQEKTQNDVAFFG